MSGLLELGRIGDLVAGDLGLQGRSGSLALVVGGKRSASGRPLLANDPHTGFRMPPLFYLAHLRAPGLELAGATWPGAPVFWTGTNLEAAWGQVALHASTSDLYMEMLHPEDPLRYDRNGKWLDAEKRVEQVEVRYGEPEALDVIVTRHGPLLGSVHPDDPSVRGYSLRWAGDDARSGIQGLLRVQRARSFKDFRDALLRYPAPLATFVFAHRDGTIGSQLAGHMPIRSIDTGLLPVLGNSRYYDWRGFTAFKDLPSKSGTDLDWIAVSTHPDQGLFTSPVKWLWRAGGARERLRDLVRDSGPLDIDDLVAIQRDTRSTRAVRVIANLLEGTEGAEGAAARVREILLEWDGSTAVDSVGASVYHAFRQVLTRRALELHLGEDFDFAMLTGAAEPVPGALLDRYVERLRPAEARALVDAALGETWDWLGVNVSANPRRWAWGALHTVRPQHAFERFGGGFNGWLGRWLGRGPFAAPGDADSVWTMHHAVLPAHRVEVGPVLRYAVDLDRADHARVGLAGGQSGHPGTPHYDDALADWLAGRPRLLWMDRGDIGRLATGRWVLRPEAQAQVQP
jgi:penicillin amidase